MNKIYNNLTIENLIKTEWFNQFNKEQQVQIRLGIDKSLDVSLYAKPEFNMNQMREVKYGLMNGVDASKYADSKLTYKEMIKIRRELQNEKQELN